MAYFDLNAIKNAMITSSWNSLIKAWYDVERVSQEISTLILSPERNLEAVTEGLKRWKEHAGLLSWNVTVHSLLLHDDARSSRLLSTAVCCWKAVQLLVVQFEKLLFNQKEKGVEDTVWLQIQGLVRKFGVLLLKRFTREQCGLDDFSLERKGPGDNDPGEKCFTRPGIPYPSKKTRRTTKSRHCSKMRTPFKDALSEFFAERRNPPKLTVEIPKTSSRPKLQRQNGVIEQ